MLNRADCLQTPTAFLAVAGLLINVGCASSSSGSGASEEAAAEYRQLIRETVGKHMPEVQSCYHRAIEEKPMSEGRVILKWAITKAGDVEGIELKQAGDKIAHVYPCLAGRLAKWKFPPTPADGLFEVEGYPFLFSENGKLKP